MSREGLSIGSQQAIVKGIDMSEDLKNLAIQTAKDAMSANPEATEQELAEILKIAFDQHQGPTWHSVVGRSFGAYITYESHHFIQFQLDSLAFVLFKVA